MNKNQKGFSVIEGLLIVLVVGLIGVVGWLVYDRQQSKKTANNADTQTTTVQQSPIAAEPQESNPNEGYLVVKEWGLRFKVPSGLTDVRYAISKDTVVFFAKPKNANVDYISNVEEKDEDGNFTYSQGSLYRSTDSTKPFHRDMTRKGKKIGNYYYYTSHSFSNLATGAGCQGVYGRHDDETCKIENKAFDLINSGDTALLNTIEQAK